MQRHKSTHRNGRRSSFGGRFGRSGLNWGGLTLLHNNYKPTSCPSDRPTHGWWLGSSCRFDSWSGFGLFGNVFDGTCNRTCQEYIVENVTVIVALVHNVQSRVEVGFEVDGNQRSGTERGENILDEVGDGGKRQILIRLVPLFGRVFERRHGLVNLLRMNHLAQIFFKRRPQNCLSPWAKASETREFRG